ncbi:hypothetical protein [Aureimonas frigidaquae]|uniref:Uncharacterized protein n=1 Tax=Aureimonas frigidaquae TaxID=424757 RepID=A0A0P0Z1Y8_9HYPH|nr:hypothetical protein [Aureimonas frigidaquae]BAT27702.1 hypothetical protein [Aureimonas frigidaquae]
MDSLKDQKNVRMRAWRVAFGGNQLDGRFKLFGFVLAFLLIGGTFFAAMS